MYYLIAGKIPQRLYGQQWVVNNFMTVGIILQAHMDSTRLPGKAMMPFGKVTLLEWIVSRVRNLPWDLVVATSDRTIDEKIADQSAELETLCFRGSDEDVLDRYYQCAKTHQFGHIIRLTGDNPFPDLEILKDMVQLHLTMNADYTHSLGYLPVGIGSEIIQFGALEKSWELGEKAHHREHVNEYIIENKRNFKICKLAVNQSKTAPELRFTIDTIEDYKKMNKCRERIKSTCMNTEELIQVCSSSV